MRAAFTAKEIKTIEDGLVSLALKSVDFHVALPFALICSNPQDAWYVLSILIS